MSILSKIITRAIVKPALRGKVKPLPTRGSQRTQMEALGFNKSPEDIPEDIPIVAPAATRAEVPETKAKDVGQQRRMNLIYGVTEDEPSLNKGGVVDMRDGGRVRMEHGGRAKYEARKGFSDETEQARKHITRVGGDAPAAYQIKHMTGLSLDIFNKGYDRLIKSGLVDSEQRQQALENFDKFTQEVFKIESSENWTASHPAGASGGFQFRATTLPPTMNRLQRLFPNRTFGSWTKDILKHKKASKLSPEQQRALFVTNMFERSLRDKKGKILKGEGDKLLIGTMKGDTGDMVDAYYKLHYAGDPDWRTMFRANTILRFEKEWEDRIFNFAKQIKKLLN